MRPGRSLAMSSESSKPRRAGFLRRLKNGRRGLPSAGQLGLAAAGGVLLAVVATTSWTTGSDEQAYWGGAERVAAGQPLYDASARRNTPYAYWNPPPLAEVLAPLTAVLSSEAFTAVWTVLLLLCLWWLGGRSVVGGLGLVAFLPVAIELRTRNVHLLLAVLIVLAVRRSWAYWIPAAALKISPVLGGVYLLAAGRVRDAVKMGLVGAAVLAVSVVVAPGAWADFFTIVAPRAESSAGALVALPFWLRFLVGGLVAAAAGRLGGRRGEILLVVGLTFANPTLWVTALSILVAIVPLWRTAAPEAAAEAKRPVEGALGKRRIATTA
jgi:Glycosyltransferase family 87